MLAFGGPATDPLTIFTTSLESDLPCKQTQTCRSGEALAAAEWLLLGCKDAGMGRGVAGRTCPGRADGCRCAPWLLTGL